MAIMKQMIVAKLAKKIVIFFSLHIFPADEEKRFLLALFTGDKPFVTFFVVVLVDAELIFLLTELKFWNVFIDGISSLLANTFCKLGIAWISMIPIQNIFFWYKFKLKDVSVNLFFMFFFS